jgi:hypothetical protein
MCVGRAGELGRQRWGSIRGGSGSISCKQRGGRIESRSKWRGPGRGDGGSRGRGSGSGGARCRVPCGRGGECSRGGGAESRGYGGWPDGRSGEGVAGEERRGNDGVQEGAGGVRERHGEGERVSSEEGAGERGEEGESHRGGRARGELRARRADGRADRDQLRDGFRVSRQPVQGAGGGHGDASGGVPGCEFGKPVLECMCMVAWACVVVLLWRNAGGEGWDECGGEGGGNCE